MLYDKLYSFDNLLLAFKKARRNNASKWYVIEFHKNLEKNLMKLESELRSMTYRPRIMKTFVIREPKTRIISASHFRDRIVHHAICNIIEPIFEKLFIYDSYAGRKGKGSHAAIRRFDVFKRKVSKNGRLLRNAKDNNMIIGYVLKADIKHYFDTVDHSILLSVLRKNINDEKVMWLIESILDNYSSHKGMPIGNLTSQFFANVYLNEFDYFVKHELRAKFYIRYLDDFVIFHNDIHILEKWKIQINEFLMTNLKLELHPEKSQIYPLHKGIAFLGFRIFYRYKLLKKSNMSAINKRIRDFKEAYNHGEISKEEIGKRLEGWFGYAIHGNTYNLRRRLSKSLTNV